MTSYASLRSAVDAMKLGAVDYIAKPFDHEEMLDCVRNIFCTAAQPIRQPPAAPALTEARRQIRPSSCLATARPWGKCFT